jgi:uncharacterized DUF497 family protein
VRYPFLVVVDASHNEEARDTVIGLDSRWNLLYVVHIERDVKRMSFGLFQHEKQLVRRDLCFMEQNLT